MGNMTRLILAAALAAAPALSAHAEPIPLSELSDYLNGIGTAEASFTQISEDGAIATGTLYLHRPGGCGSNMTRMICWSWRAAGRWRSSMAAPTPGPNNTRCGARR